MPAAIEPDPTDLKRYVPPLDAPEAVIVDLDTVALRRNNGLDDRVKERPPNLPVLRVVRSLVAVTNCATIFTTGRSEQCRPAAERWLAEHYVLQYEALLMRYPGDDRPDWQVVYELFDEHVRHRYQVIGAFEDRSQVVRMWRQIGLVAFQTGAGTSDPHPRVEAYPGKEYRPGWGDWKAPSRSHPDGAHHAHS